MSKPKLLLTVDVVAFAALLFLAGTGAIMRFVLPPGSGHFSALWGMDRHEWGEIHYWIALTLLAIVALHLILHGRWIVHAVCGRPGERSGVRVAAAAAALGCLLALTAAPFFGKIVPKENAEDRPHRGQTERRAAEQHAPVPDKPGGESAGKETPAKETHGKNTPKIDGTMTLRDVERSTGVSASAIILELKLPADLPADERLGRLRKQYGFEMHDVRRIVEEHMERQKK